MGTAAQKRNQARINYLKKLAQKDINLFSVEWDSRLKSWVKEMEKRVQNQSDSTEMAYNIINKALEMLEICFVNSGQEKEYETFKKGTQKFLEGEYCKIVAKVYDHNLNRLISLFKK